jgi:hypothetical protein
VNKYLMLTAAALLATSAGARAGTHSFAFGTSGGNYCTSFTVTTGLDGGLDHNGVWAIVYDSCNGGPNNYGQGLVADVKGMGQVADMSDTVFGQNYGIFSEQISFVLPKKLKAGKPWSLWVGFDGVSSYEADSGVLVNPGEAARSSKSTLDAVRQLINARGGRN